MIPPREPQALPGPYPSKEDSSLLYLICPATTLIVPNLNVPCTTPANAVNPIPIDPIPTEVT